MRQEITTTLTIQELQEMMRETWRSEFKVNNKEPPSEADVFLTRRELAKLLRLSLPTITKLYNEKVIEGLRCGNKIIFSKAGVLKSLDLINNKKYSKRTL